jgi:effector-binding domain-containing protein
VFKIGDFSRLSLVSVKALRYYDEIGLLTPVKVDQFTGYRYYSAEQLPRLNYILALKDLGLSLEDIALLIKDNLTPSQMRDIFLLKKAELAQRVTDEQQKLERVERLLQHLEQEGKMSAYQVTVKKLEPQLIASVRETLPNYGACAPLFGEVYQYLAKKLVFKPAGPPFMLYHDPEYKEKDVDIEIGVPITKAVQGSGRVKVYELAGVEIASTVYKGPYSGVNAAYQAVLKWCEANGYEFNGPCREVYLTDPNDLADPSANITEIQVPVKKA